MWGEHGDRPEPLASNDSLFGAFMASCSIEVACTQAAAWELVTSVERIGEFSPECIDAVWIDHSSGACVGARFQGTNRVVLEDGASDYVWIRPCTITIAEAPRRFGYTVGDRYDGTPACAWEVEIEQTATGCRITQRFQHLSRGLSGIRHAADADPDHAEEIIESRVEGLVNGMNETLERMKRVLESDPSSSGEAPRA